MIDPRKNKDELIKAIMIASSDKAVLEAFLEDLLTPRERNALPKRWEIVRRLYKGQKQWDVAEDLKLGVATVTRGSRELKDKNGGFIKVLKKLYK